MQFRHSSAFAFDFPHVVASRIAWRGQRHQLFLWVITHSNKWSRVRGPRASVSSSSWEDAAKAAGSLTHPQRAARSQTVTCIPVDLCSSLRLGHSAEVPSLPAAAQLYFFFLLNCSFICHLHRYNSSSTLQFLHGSLNQDFTIAITLTRLYYKIKILKI